MSAAKFRFIVEEARTGKILSRDLTVSNARVMRTLSGPCSIEFDVDHRDPSVEGIYFKPWGQLIHVEAEVMGRKLNPAYDPDPPDPPEGETAPPNDKWLITEPDRRIWCTGIVQPSTIDKKTGKLRLKAEGFMSYPKGLPWLENWNPFTVDVFETVHKIWDHVQSYPGGDLGVKVTPAESGVVMLPGYAFDGAIWNLNFFAEFIRASDRRDCGDHITGLARDVPFDMFERSEWNSDRTAIQKTIELSYPRGGLDQVNLVFALNENVYEAEPHAETEIDWVSDIGIAGWFPNKEYSVQISNADPTRFRRYLAEDDAKINSTERAAAWAHRRLTRRQTPAYWESIIVDMNHPNAPFGFYDVGDRIMVQGLMPWVGYVKEVHKITAISVDEASGACEIKLKAEGAFSYDPIYYEGKPVPPTGQEPNLLPNGYFGENMSGWLGGKGQWFRETQYGHMHAGCARIDCNDGGEWMSSTAHIPVNPGEVYEISVWMRQNGIEGSGAESAQLMVLTNAYQDTEDDDWDLIYRDAVVIDTLAVAEGNETWRKMSGFYTIPEEGVASIDVRLLVLPDITDGIMWWDEAMVKLREDL